MGKRVDYQIIGRRGNVVLTLYNNNSHSYVDPDRLFINTVEAASGITRAVFTLLDLTYPSSGGNHRSGDPIFTICRQDHLPVDVDPGDQEYIIRANFGKNGPRFERLFDGMIMDRIPFGMVVDASETPVLGYQIIKADQSVGAAFVSDVEPGTHNALSDMKFSRIMRQTDRTLTQKVVDLMQVMRGGKSLFRFDVQMHQPVSTIQARVHGLVEGWSEYEPMFVHGL